MAYLVEAPTEMTDSRFKTKSLCMGCYMDLKGICEFEPTSNHGVGICSWCDWKTEVRVYKYKCKPFKGWTDARA